MILRVQSIIRQFPAFRPHPLLRNPHAQTIFPAYFRQGPLTYRATPREVQLPDGDRIVLHDDRPPGWQEGDRVVLMVHGLAGCHNSPYMPRIAGKLNNTGVRTFRMDLRGCGAALKIARKPGHAGRGEDALAAVHEIAEICPDSPVTAIGFSMGGNIVLKMAADCGEIPPANLDTVMAVAPPIDILKCSLNMLEPRNRIYTRSFSKSLYKLVKQRRQFCEEITRIPLKPRPKTLIDFDDRFTAPLSGYEDARDYYAQASSGPLLRHIRVPTVIIAAADDPVIPVSIFEEATLSPSTQLHVTEHGGHVGFFAARGSDPDRRWLDWRIVEYIIGLGRNDDAKSPTLTERASEIRG